MTSDMRRKLSQLDYARIRFYAGTDGKTRREIASAYGISTKYVGRVIGAEVNFTGSGTATYLISQTTLTQSDLQPYTFGCSGCGMHFPFAGLQAHYAVWTSGGTKELECGEFMPHMWPSTNSLVMPR